MILFSIVFFCILIIVCISFTQNKERLQKIQKENAIYEEYKQRSVLGTEVVSIIHKAIDSNLKNEVEKDEKGFFIENNTNSIKVEVKLRDDKNLVPYQMETIQKVGTDGFVKNFNLILFQCTNIEYHKSTKRVSKIVFEQIEE